MGNMRRVLCILSIVTAVAAALPGCRWMGSRPIDSQDSIYKGQDRPADPAVRSPYLGVGTPGRAVSPEQVPQPGTPIRADMPKEPLYASVDVPASQPTVQAWVDGQSPVQAVGNRIIRIAQPVSRQPKLRFEIDAKLGQFRGATIQIYRLIAGQPDIATGLRVSEDGEPILLTPGSQIDLGQLTGSLVCRRTASNEQVRNVELEPGADYEIHFLVSGSKRAGSVAVRVRTIPLPGTSQPDDTSGTPSQPGQTGLPPGVVIPK